MRNYFILDGVDSRDFGVYISGQGTFNASGRDYNIIPVPGRNGDLVGPEKRFANGTLTYPAFIYSNFKTNIEAFRNFLLSLVGYHDLVDSYHPDQIRKVLFQGPFTVDVQTKNDAGRFDIEFICKPQRFLASGNEVTTFESAGETETFSGSVVTFDNPGGATVSALSTAINPVQSGSGDPSPTNVRPITGWTGANVYDDPAYGGLIKWNQLAPAINTTDWLKASNVSSFEVTDGVATVTVNTTSTSNTFIRPNVSSVQKGHIVYVCADMKCDNPQSVQEARVIFYESSSKNQTLFNSDVSATWQRFESVNTISVDAIQMRFLVSSPSAAYTYYIKNAQIFDLTEMFGEGNEPSTVAEFKRLFPDEYYAYDNTYAEKTVSEVNGDPYVSIPISFGTAGTVYGGTLDVVNGTLTVDKAIVDLGTLTWSKFTVTQGTMFRAPIADSANVSSTVAADAICSMYPVVAQTSRAEKTLSANGTNYDIIDSSYSTAADFKTAMSGVQLVYELATPQTYTLTPTEVALLLGANNVWSDTGDITATIAIPQAQFTITNPTLFDSQPFLRVYGTGTLGINSQSVTITQADEYTDIDCEMMDCFKGTANKNPYVQFTDYNFPVLKPGVNYVSLSGITKVEITPRWWIV